MECRTLTPNGYAYCEHYEECRKLKVCLCEVNLRKSIKPHKRKEHIEKLPWPKRKQQILQLIQRNTITTATIMDNIDASQSASARWLRQLAEEGIITRKASHFRYSPAIYVMKEDK